MRGRSGHDKARAVVVAYLRVSGPVGPLTSVYSELTASPLTATNPLVTTSIIKSDVFPGLWPGAAALFSGGEGAHMLLKRQRSPVVGGEVSAVF